MIGKDLFDGFTGTQLAQYLFDRDTRASDDWLAQHDLGINFDPVVRHGALRRSLLFITEKKYSTLRRLS